jgi:hypothetical protein
MYRAKKHEAPPSDVEQVGFVDKFKAPVAKFFEEHGYKPAEQYVLDLLRSRYPEAERRAEQYAVAQAIEPTSKYGVDLRVVPNSSPALTMYRPSRPQSGLMAFHPDRADAAYVPDWWEGNPGELVDIGRTRLTPRGGLGSFAPPEGPSVMHRGMSDEELREALSRGFFHSRGDWNLPGQDALTFFSSRPSQAESYASGFAPWQFKPTFDRPAWVASVKRPSEIAQIVGETELGVKGPVSVDDLVALHRGDVYGMDAANWNLVDDWGTKHLSGTAPSSYVTWSPVDPGSVK